MSDDLRYEPPLDEDWEIYQPDPYDEEIGKQLMREANERNMNRRKRLLASGLIALLLWGWGLWKILRTIYG